MLYVCDNCGARFSGTDQQSLCPDCGMDLLHPANQVEQHEYISQVADLLREKLEEEPHYPSAVMTEILISSCFSFKLPVSALHIDNAMIVEISVDFGENADRSELTGNVWVRQENGKMAEFLLSLYLPSKQGETTQEQVNRIFTAINGNREFRAALSDYVSRRLLRKN